MAQKRATAVAATPSGLPNKKPDSALRKLDRFVGTWDIKGHTLDSKDDNITGRVVIDWLPGGFFMQQRGEYDLLGTKINSLEVIGYDPAIKAFTSTVYSNVDDGATTYHWDVQGNTVTHWTAGSKYTGTFSEDGNTLAGGWRPDEGVEENAGNTYDAVMIRVR